MCHVYWTIYNHNKQLFFNPGIEFNEWGEIVEQCKLSLTTYFELESAHMRSSLSLFVAQLHLNINLL